MYNKRAFSFLKLMIVIIIISFLSFVSESYFHTIKTFQIKSVLVKIHELQMATEFFRKKYNALPGDSNIIPLTISGKHGNNNDLVGYEGYQNPESLLFFKHLSLTNLLDEDYSLNEEICITINDVAINQNYPGVPLNKSYFIYAQSSDFGGVFSRRNRFALFSKNGKGVGSLKAYLIDKKIDDGKPLSGAIMTIRAKKSDLANANFNCISTPSNIEVRHILNNLQIEMSEYNKNDFGCIVLFPMLLEKIELSEEYLVRDLNCLGEDDHNVNCIDYCNKYPKQPLCTEMCRNNPTEPLFTFCHHKDPFECTEFLGKRYCHSCKEISGIFIGREHGYAQWPETPISTKEIIGTCSEDTQTNPKGYPRRDCDFKGRWTSVINPCLPIYCFEIRKEFSLGKVDGYATWKQTRTGRTTAGACLDGYKGLPIRQCLSNGEWGKIEQSCEPI